MLKYDTDLDYVILDIDICEEELEEIIDEADKIISENKESKQNMAVAYLKKAQCLRKLDISVGKFIYNCEIVRSHGCNIHDINRLIEKALELRPNMPEALMQLGISSYDWAGDKEEKSIIYFNKAIKLKPDYAAAFNNRAMLFYDYQTVYDHANNFCFIRSNKDSFEGYTNNFRNAIADLTEAIRLRPFDALYYLYRGTFHSTLEEHKEAVEDFSNAINYASDVLIKEIFLKKGLLIFNLRGEEYAELENYAKAIDDFSESLRLKPDHNDTLLMRVRAYYLSGEKDKAKMDFKKYLNRKCGVTFPIYHNEILNLQELDYVLKEETEKNEFKEIDKSTESESLAKDLENIKNKYPILKHSEGKKQEMKNLAKWCLEIERE